MAKHIIVIGGGMAGTSAAHELLKRGYAVTIVEKDSRLGGRVYSHIVDGAAVEMGAGFLTRTYTNLWAFLDASGLSRQLKREQSKSAIYYKGEVIPVNAKTVLGNRVLGWSAKFQAVRLFARMLLAWPHLDRHAFWKAARYDTRTVAAMVTGRGSAQIREYMLQPVLNGYFYWAPEHISQAMMLILCKEALSHGTYRLAGGLQRIPEKLAEDAALLLDHEVRKVTWHGGRYSVTVTHARSDKTLTADGVVCATTASAVPAIFPDMSQGQEAFFSSVAYSSGALIARTYPGSAALDDTSIAFPRREGIELSAVTLSRETGNGQEEFATIKTYASGSSAAKLASLSDELLAKALIEQMEPSRQSVLAKDGEPIATHLQRWSEALPYFDVGHFRRLEQFENGGIEDQSRPLVFAGDYIGGPFMEGAFTSGLRAAERLDSRLSP